MSSSDRTLSVRAIVALYRAFEQAARKSDLSVAQYRTLLYLYSGPKHAGAIAAAGAIKKPTVSAMLATLREKGWIESAADASDARVSRVEITQAGRERLEAFEAEMAGLTDALLPAAERAAFRAALSGAYKALGAHREEWLRGIERQFLE
ncbi:MarR family transcriptional regulator [Oleomonas cavernae]|uniref:MarR family transcriptional regulator n=1 Tax=Oleomonas cavernae TaxID=2320859 RepID=A0A418WF60_9PROT|nr:MarR family transcriptional regulator [Oleomonas cavernae]RJF88668.1 MarR family transcriptional regulator [Oleomonas cavernae]